MSVKLESREGTRKLVVRPHRIPTKVKKWTATQIKESGGRERPHGAYLVDGEWFTDTPGPKVIEFAAGKAEVHELTWAEANRNGEANAAGIFEV